MFYPAEAGQHNSCLLHQPQGWDSVPQPGVADEEPLVLVHGEKHHATGSVLARQTQCGGRRGVQDTDRQVILELGSCSVRATGCTVGATEAGLVRAQADKAMPSVFQLETGPAGSGHGCLSAAMERSGSICESSLELGGEDRPRSGCQPLLEYTRKAKSNISTCLPPITVVRC